jgi:hypothetical protein
MDFLKFHSGPPCLTLLRPTGLAACGHLTPLWTPHVVRLCPSIVCLNVEITLHIAVEDFVAVDVVEAIEQLLHHWRWDWGRGRGEEGEVGNGDGVKR